MNEPQSRIMVVEDTEANIDVIVDTLGSDYELSIAMDGESALNMIEEINPDLILLDIMMPGIDGYEVCQRLKAEVATQEIPIIFLTALSDNEDEARGLHLGAVDYITKPFNPDVMKSRVMIHLELSRSRIALQEQRDRIDDDFQRLRELERLRDDLVNMIIHDMRAPIMGICGRLEIAIDLLKKEKMPNDIVEDLDAALESGFSLNSMICSLLDINRFESGKMPLNYQQTDMVTLTKSVIDNIGTPERNCSIKLEQNSQDIQAMCDPDMINQTITNLIHNALRYSPVEGEICVELVKEDEWCRIGITDQGPGIPEEYHDSIFEIFSQLDEELGNDNYTSGLGLTYCKLAVDAHGGSIQLDSESETGTTFYVRLPAKKEEWELTSDLRTGASQENDKADAEEESNPTILIVDDSRIVTDTLKRYFDKHSDWDTIAINQADRAVRVARRIRPDLILIDINMPGQMGSEVAEELCEYPEIKNTQIIYHTELIAPEEVDLDMLQNYGKYPVIPKGIPLARVATLVYELLLEGIRIHE